VEFLENTQVKSQI